MSKQSQKKQKLIIISVVITAFVFYFGIRVIFEDDEARIRKVINSGDLAVETKNWLRCATLFWPEYVDEFGQDRHAAVASVSHFLTPLVELRVELKRLIVTLDKENENEAKAEVWANLFFKSPRDGKSYYDGAKVIFSFEKRGKSWKIIGTKYTESVSVLMLHSVA